jgi:hypothetical protein
VRTRVRVLALLVGLAAPVSLGLTGDAGSAAPAATPHREPAQRYLVFRVNKQVVKKGKAIVISGLIQPPTAPAECIAGVALTVERSTKGAIYNPIGTVTTDAAGNYMIREKVTRKVKFRMSAPATAACVEMQSPPRTISIKK